MRGALIAAGLLLTILAFALAFVPRRIALGALGVAAVVALAAAVVGGVPVEAAFAGCWISLLLAALSVYWPRFAQANAWLCFVFAANAGVWAGLVMSTEEPPMEILRVLVVLLLGVPAAWCSERGWGIAIRVVASWLLAVAVLVGAIPHLVAHPGYVQDHRI